MVLVCKLDRRDNIGCSGAADNHRRSVAGQRVEDGAGLIVTCIPGKYQWAA
jgi:hypothetical protein